MSHVQGCNCSECKRVTRAANREHKRKVEARNAASRPLDPYLASRGRAAFIAAYQHVADSEAQSRIARAIIVNGVIEHHSIEHAREILARNLHTRSLVVQVRETDKVAKHMRANSAYVNTQAKVRNARDAFISQAHNLHTLRADYMRAKNTHETLTGKARKANRDLMRAMSDKLAREFGAHV